MATAEELLEAIRDQGDRSLTMIAEMQAVAAAQREANRIAIDRLGTAQGSDPLAVAGTGETAPPASSHAPDTLDPKYSYVRVAHRRSIDSRRRHSLRHCFNGVSH